MAELDADGDAGLTVAEAAGLLRRIATYPNYAVYVATHDSDPDTLVGTFARLVMDNLAHRGTPSAVVEDVVVAAGARGQGIGRVMMEFAMDVARRHGCYKLVLSSNGARTRAHDFYRSPASRSTASASRSTSSRRTQTAPTDGTSPCHTRTILRSHRRTERRAEP